MFELKIFLKDQLIGRSVFEKDEVRIGRTADNEVQIDNLGLSRYHASIEAVSGAYVLKDFGSQNGTFVNGERVSGRRALDDGDRIGLGKFALHFNTDKRPAPSARVSDEAAYAVAGETLVTRAGPAASRERPCPWAAFLEAPAQGIAPPAVHVLARDFFLVGSGPGCQLTLEKGAARQAVIVRAWNGFSILPLASGVQRNLAAIDFVAELKNGDELDFAGTKLKFRVGRPDGGP